LGRYLKVKFISMNNLVQRSFLNALGTVAYVTVVGLFMQNAQKLFGKTDKVTTPILVLTLFVVSASITSSLVLGKPILMYLDGQKNEAIRLFIYTICWLVLFVLILVAATLII
jgi:hypothetical protein